MNITTNNDLENLRLIEKLESFYLSQIRNSLGIISEVKNELESQNKIMNQFLNPSDRGAIISEYKSFFDIGAERVIYNRLSRQNQLGTPNSAPIGADLFFEKNTTIFEDGTYDLPVIISLDLKTVRANEGSAIGDVCGDIPVGVNQNSYKTQIKYNDGQIRNYTPRLQPSYRINNNEAIVLTYLIVVLYELEPDVQNPQRMNVLMMSSFCIPNGKLEANYKTRVFNPGKSGKLSLSPGQEIHGPGNQFHETRLENTSRGLPSSHPDLLANLKKKWNCSNLDIYNATKNETGKLLEFDNLDGRFDYMDCSSFELFNSGKKRYDVLFFDNNKAEKYLPKLQFYKDNYSS